MCLIQWCSLWMFAVTFIQLSESLLAPQELAFMIISQRETHSIQAAEHLRSSILLQAQIETVERNIQINRVQQPQIILSHETFNVIGSWAITPILASSSKHIENLLSTNEDDNVSVDGGSGISTATTNTNTKWLILCEDQSVVDLKALINNLEMEDCTKDVFLGYPLRDTEATIIHHFAFFENPSWFSYPLFKAGVAISIPLLRNLTERVRREKIYSDFFIDASHELSLFAWNKGRGHKLTQAPYFCASQRPSSSSGHGCAIYFKENNNNNNNRNNIGQQYRTTGTLTNKTNSVTLDEILFGVKTWSKNHIERLPIIQNTWGADAVHIRYFSDTYDSKIPTIKTNTENTDHGHCAKAIAIFKLIADELNFNRNLSTIKWFVLADDDTLLSTSALAKYLEKFNADSDIYLGERYGYQLLSSNGFNYITGGGGIVFSLSVLKKLATHCQCPSPSSPDDMIIALCLQRLGVEPIHSSKFHQARPMDYPPEYHLHDAAISFHKFWQIDPFDIYDKWLRSSTVQRDKSNNDYHFIKKYDVNYDSYCSNDQQQMEQPLCERQQATGANTFPPDKSHCDDVNKKVSKEKHIDL